VRRAELPDHPRSSVVSGGASGIGLGIVRHLLALGGSVVAVDRDAQACASARAAFGRLDLVFNNAAIHPIATIEEMDLAAWHGMKPFG
jgi:NAD(P)-dependent dehydrogenase (short-subunit alcohol dehydrogenase family)